MDVEIRRVGADRWDDIVRALQAAFGEEFPPEEVEAERPMVERGRGFAAFDGDTLVGSAIAVPQELTVPGGTLPVGSVTAVGVMPTHRRRGVARSLLLRQTEDLHDEGIPLAYLWASENRIYQRFGYGIGALSASFEIRRQDTEWLRPVEPRGRMRLVPREEALKLFPAVYDQIRPSRPGMLDRDEAWWNALFLDIEKQRDGATPYFYAAYETDEGLEGYVVYRVKEGWGHRTGPDYTLNIEELLAATDDAYLALWRYCFEVDLVRQVKGWKRPVDEPLLYTLAEPRGLGLSIRDGTWLRLVDVRPALEGRRYATEDRVVFEIADDFCPWNAGRWALEGGTDGASCSPTDAVPDLVLDAGTLACSYLGAVPFRSLQRARRVEARTDAAIRRADAMFATDAAPWCPHVF